MSDMFSRCYKLNSIDLSNFNTNNVTNMSDMFSGCKSSNSIDLSNFNTTNVTDMSGMFNNISNHCNIISKDKKIIKIKPQSCYIF